MSTLKLIVIMTAVVVGGALIGVYGREIAAGMIWWTFGGLQPR